MTEALPTHHTIAEASALTGKSPDQIRRAIRRAKEGKAGGIAHTIDPISGAYLMTTEALLGAGYDLRTTSDPETARLKAELAEAREQLHQAQQEKAEALDLARRTLEALDNVTRALGGGATRPEASATRSEAIARPARWWQKRPR